jgi:hypothetical protein
MSTVGLRSLWRTVSIASLGGVMGAIGVSLLRSTGDGVTRETRVSDRHVSPEPMRSSSPQEPMGARGVAVDPGDMALMRQRIAKLESQLASLADAANIEVRPTFDGGRQSSVVADEARRDRILESYEREGVDARWAPQAQRGLSEPLLADTRSDGFELKSMDCHTTSCVAWLRWPPLLAELARYCTCATRSLATETS